MLLILLKEYKYNKKTFEIYFKNSKIIFNIYNIISNLKNIKVKDLRKLFYYYKKDLYTAVLYYNNKNLTKIRLDKISRVINILIKKKKYIENIYFI